MIAEQLDWPEAAVLMTCAVVFGIAAIIMNKTLKNELEK